MKICKSLLPKNTFSTHFMYAIAETILVVICILIALQINNWNENKKETQKERAFLKEIRLDFKSNKAQLEAIIAFNKMNYHAGLRLQEILKKFDSENQKVTAINRKYANSIGYYNNLVRRNKSCNPKNESVEALLSSSSFGLITNDTLRRKLIRWKDVLDDYLEEVDFAMQYLFHEYGTQQQNYLFKRTGDQNNNLSREKEKGLIVMITKIIRLTQLQTNN